VNLTSFIPLQPFIHHSHTFTKIVFFKTNIDSVRSKIFVFVYCIIGDWHINPIVTFKSFLISVDDDIDEKMDHIISLWTNIRTQLSEKKIWTTLLIKPFIRVTHGYLFNNINLNLRYETTLTLINKKWAQLNKNKFKNKN